jgi:hypothetical protein
MKVGKAKKLEACLPNLFSRSFLPLKHIRKKARNHVLVRGELNERSRAKEENIHKRRGRKDDGKHCFVCSSPFLNYRTIWPIFET